MEEPGSSRDIPLPIEREVRKRCGFGCVVCGLPLHTYAKVHKVKLPLIEQTSITLQEPFGDRWLYDGR
jgi:hypothetical protein